MGGDGLEGGLGEHTGVLETLHHLDDLILVPSIGDDDLVRVVNVGVEEVEDVDELFGAWRKVLGGESTGVLVLPEEVEQPPGELLLDLFVLEVSGVLYRLAADQTAPSTGSLQLAHAAVSRHASCQTWPEDIK